VFLVIFWATRPPPPETGVPSTAATVSTIVSRALEQAQEQWSRSDRQGALATIEAALASEPNDLGLRRFLSEMVSDARAALKTSPHGAFRKPLPS
jgi:hypothetical protein